MKTRTEQILDSFHGDTIDDLVFWSFRYFLGRRTIATCCFARGLARAYHLLHRLAQAAIKRELDQAFERGEVGHPIDAQGWELVRMAWRDLDKNNDTFTA